MHKLSKKMAIKHAITLFLLLQVFAASSQTRIVSPYSRYGLGEITFNQNFRNLGFGGIGIGYRSNHSVNFINPASYTAIDSSTFILEGTMFSHFYQQKTATQSQNGNYSSLANLSFAFPIKRWWGVGAGLRPFSMVGYKVFASQEQEGVGTINYLYEGEGGVNQVFFGNSIRPFKGFNLGVNASYLFGSIDKNSSVGSSEEGFLLTRQLLSHKIQGWYFNFGTQLQLNISPQSFITLGAIYSPETNINAFETETLLRQKLGFANRFDTIAYKEGEKGNLTLPQTWGAGIFAKFNQSWSAGLDFQAQAWENFSINENQGGLNNAHQLAFGIQHNPKISTSSGFLSFVDYRAGFRYGQSYLNVNEQAFNEFGISFGVGIPVFRSRSKLNIGFEYSQRGTTDNNLIKEDIFKVNITLNIIERLISARFL